MDIAVIDAHSLERMIRGAVQSASKDYIQEPQVLKERKSWLTNAEALEYLGLSKATLSRFRSSGILPYSKVGKSVYYRRIDLDKLLQANLQLAEDGEGSHDP